MTTWGGNSYARTSRRHRRLPEARGGGDRARRSARSGGIPRGIRHGVHRHGRARRPDPLLLQRERCDEGCRPVDVAEPRGRRRHDRRSARARVHGQGLVGGAHLAQPRRPRGGDVPDDAPGRRDLGHPAAAARDLGDVGRRQGTARDGLHPRHARRGRWTRRCGSRSPSRRRAMSTDSCRGCRSTAATARCAAGRST